MYVMAVSVASLSWEVVPGVGGDGGGGGGFVVVVSHSAHIV